MQLTRAGRLWARLHPPSSAWGSVEAWILKGWHCVDVCCSDMTSGARDVAWLGSCDDGCLEFARKLGFEEELRALHEQGHAALQSS
jgi:hypothetical protein